MLEGKNHFKLFDARQMDWKNRWLDGQTKDRTDGRMNRQRTGQMEEWIDKSGNTEGGSITVRLTSCLSGLDSAV
jgi:hypothetical protein